MSLTRSGDINLDSKSYPKLKAIVDKQREILTALPFKAHEPSHIMKTKLNQIVIRILCLCALVGATASRAADGVWTTDGDGNWSDIANWNSGAGPIADASGSTAYFTNTITVGRTVTSDTARTIGNLFFTGSGALSWTLTNSAAITLATGSGVSTITVSSNTATFNASGAGLAGAQTVLKNGPGILAWLGITLIPAAR